MSARFRENVFYAYGNEYDLTPMIWRGNRHPVDMVCPDHGLFCMKPKTFLTERGCPKCQAEHHPRGTPRLRPHGRPNVAYSLCLVRVGVGRLGLEMREGSVPEGTIYGKTFDTRKRCALLDHLIRGWLPTSYGAAGSIPEAHLMDIITLIQSVPSEGFR